MQFVTALEAADTWDVVVVGSGFGSLFFLKRYLELKPNSRVLILERGRHNTTDWQLEQHKNSDVEESTTFVNESPKEWVYTIGLGGSTNCWWAQSPRLHPSDFALKTRHGVGADWPVTYDDLVPYYRQVERIMPVAGPDDLDSEFPGTGSYPQKPHRMSSADELIRATPGHKHFVIPNARLTETLNGRGRCCASSECNFCPTGAKFTAFNGLQDVLSHRNVRICTEAHVRSLDVEAGQVRKAVFTQGGKDYAAAGDFFVLGANGVFNPWILMKSGIGGHGVGRYFGEKLHASVEILLDGHQHFDGGTVQTCFNLSRLETPTRGEMGAAVYYFENNIRRPGLRMTQGRWREFLQVTIYVEDILQETNGIFDEGGELPVVRHAGFTPYATKSLQAAVGAMPELLRALPVESIEMKEIYPVLGHLQGSARMGLTKADSVVDADLLHHEHRNLAVVGTSAFPTLGSVNPTLTAAALSMRAAERIAGPR